MTFEELFGKMLTRKPEVVIEMVDDETEWVQWHYYCSRLLHGDPCVVAE